LIILLCASVASIAGFAFSAIASPLLMHAASDPVQAVQIMLVASIALQTYGVWKLRKDIVPASLLPYFAGGMLTVTPGLYLLLNTPQHLYLLALGGFLVTYATYLLFRPALRLNRDPVLIRVLMGGVGGITGAVAAFPGASVTIWCGSHGWSKERQRAIYQPFILGMQVLTVIALAILKPSQVLRLETLQYAVPAIAGAGLGYRIFEHLKTDQFNKLVSIFLLISGLALCIRVF
jgi:uncharacterized membrane protein YfcA